MVVFGPMKLILWDWNGTLLNDTPLNADVFNQVRAELGYEPVSIERYRELYRHPISKMYEDSGFDFSRHPFEDVARRWSEVYRAVPEPPPLHDGARDVLSRAQGRGSRQAILSALPHHLLEAAIEHHQLGAFFETVRGATDLLGHSKVAQGVDLARELGVYGKEISLIGDSSHDAEVAQELGAGCWLVSHGAESESRLLQTGYPVCASLGEAYDKMSQAFSSSGEPPDA